MKEYIEIRKGNESKRYEGSDAFKQVIEQAKEGGWYLVAFNNIDNINNVSGLRGLDFVSSTAANQPKIVIEDGMMHLESHLLNQSKEQSEERECEYEELFKSYPFEIAHNPNCAKCVNGVCVKSTKQSEPKEAEAKQWLIDNGYKDDLEDDFDWGIQEIFAKYAAQAVAKREEEIIIKADSIIYTALLGLYQDNGLSVSAANRESVKQEILTHLKNKK